MSGEADLLQGDIPRDWTDLLPRIEAASQFFAWRGEMPPADFDPREERFQQILAVYGLPPQPDPNTFKARHAFWRKMFSRKLSPEDPPPTTPEEMAASRVEFVPATFRFEGVEVEFDQDGKPVFALPRPRAGSTLLKQTGSRRGSPPAPRRQGKPSGNRETSLNWSGLYVMAHDGRIITEIHGSWTVPKVDLPIHIGVDDLNDAGELRSSSWIGIDGQRGYHYASLPQIGTSHFVKRQGGSRRPVLGVWWQWWLRDVPNPPPIKLPLTINPGDEIAASLFVVGPQHVKLLIANRGTGQVCTPFVTTVSSSYLPPPLPDDPNPEPVPPVRISGATGEWITERPMNWTTGRLDDLPHYEVVFKDCLVVLGRGPGRDEREERPAGNLLITGTRTGRNPHRTVTVSEPRRLSRDTFSTTYVGDPALLPAALPHAETVGVAGTHPG